MKLWEITIHLLDKDTNPTDELTQDEVEQAIKVDPPANCDVGIKAIKLLNDFSV